MDKIKDPIEEVNIYKERMIRFLQLVRIYEMVLALPPEPEDLNSLNGRRGTMMSVIYSFFYSLIEDREDSVNFFRIWRDKCPDLSSQIDALEQRITPFKERLKIYRNRFGFHGSVDREYEEKAFDLLKKHSGSELFSAIIDMRNLSTQLIHSQRENAIRSGEIV